MSHLAYVNGFSILLVFSRCCIFAFFRVFSGDLRFYYSHLHPYSTLFLNIFLSVGLWASLN